VLASFQARGTSLRSGTGLSVTDTDRDGLADIVVSGPGGSTRRVLLGSTIAQKQAALRLSQLTNPRFASTLNPGSFLAGALPLVSNRRGRH
jgi:hypothetical protein